MPLAGPATPPPLTAANKTSASMERGEVTAYIALGANLGDAQAALQQATAQIAALPHTQLLAGASLYRSAPVDAVGPDYLNTVVAIATRLTAPALLAQLQALEQGAGRTRDFRNAPRTLDLDLLLYGEAHIDSPTLTVPHPRMYLRAFVLLPLHEIAPARVDAAQLQAVRSQKIAVFYKE